MSFCVNFPLFLIVLSLLFSVISSVLHKKAARVLSLVLSGLSAAANFVLFLYVMKSGENVTYLMGHFPHPWGNELRIGLLEALFSAAFSLILFLTLLGGKAPLLTRVEERKGQFYYCMCDLIQASLLSLVYTNDLFTGYVFIEICTIASCGILMIRENGKTILASVRYMIFSLIGSGLFLLGVILLYDITGHLLMPNLKESVREIAAGGSYRLPLLASMSLIIIGLSVKSGLCPFHLWMADTYGAAIPTSSGILSGLISKGYIFLLIKIIFDVFGTEVFYASGVHNVLYALGALGIIAGSVAAMRENNILRMSAYSSAAQIGYIYMGLGLSPVLGMEASLFHILVHAFTKPPLFLAAGLLSDSMGGAKKFRNLQGAGYVNPAAGAAFSFEAFSMIGLPLTMGFISKYLFGIAAFESTHHKMIPTLLVLAVSTVLNTLYFARTILRIYNREISPNHGEKVTVRSEKLYLLSALAFVLLNLFFGTAAKPFIDILAEGIAHF